MDSSVAERGATLRAMKHFIVLAVVVSFPMIAIAATSQNTDQTSFDDKKPTKPKPSLAGNWKTSAETLTITDKKMFTWTSMHWCAQAPCKEATEMTGSLLNTHTKALLSVDKRKRDLFCDFTLADAATTMVLKCTFRNDPKDGDKVTTLSFKRTK